MKKSYFNEFHFTIKGTLSAAERCDLVGVKLEKVHELFQVFAFVPKEWQNYTAQFGSFYTKS